MKIAVLSDIHDHIDNLGKVLEGIRNQKAEALIFCGDLVSPFTAGLLADANLPTYACLGNNDEDQIGMMKMGGKNITWFNLSQECGEIKLDGKKIAFCHYPKLANFLAESGQYDAVFYGHTHRTSIKKINNTLFVNPGAVCGISFEKKGYDKASFAIYDTSTNSSKIIEFRKNQV